MSNSKSNKRDFNVNDNIGGSTVPKVSYANIQKAHIENSEPSNIAAKDRKKKRKVQDDKNDTPNPPEVTKVNNDRDDTAEEEEDVEEKEETSPQIQFGDLPATSVALEEALEREAKLQERMDRLVQERMDQLAERSKLEEDSMTNNNQNQKQISVFNENLHTLDAKVNRTTVLAFINQFRAGDLQKDPYQLVFMDARAIISKKFLENRDCNTRI